MSTGKIDCISDININKYLNSYNDKEKSITGIPTMPEDLRLLLERCFQSRIEQKPLNFYEVVETLIVIYRNACGENYTHREPKSIIENADIINNQALSMYNFGREEPKRV